MSVNVELEGRQLPAKQALRLTRPSSERVLMIITLLLTALATCWLGLLSGGFWLLLALSWLAMGPLSALFEGATVLRSGALVGPECRPEWQQSLDAAAKCLGVPRLGRVRLLVRQDPQLNAAALWWPRSPFVVLNSGLADRLAAPGDEALRRAICGHELGHVLWHQPWNLWARLPGGISGLVRLPWLPLILLLNLLALAWSRRAEQAADRLALLASGSLLDTARVLLLVQTGVYVEGTAGMRAQLAEQAAARSFGMELLPQLLSTHPLLALRVQRVAAFALSPSYARIAGAGRAALARDEAGRLGLPCGGAQDRCGQQTYTPQPRPADKPAGRLKRRI